MSLKWHTDPCVKMTKDVTGIRKIKHKNWFKTEPNNLKEKNYN